MTDRRKLLRAVRTGKSINKTVLLLLDDHIGPKAEWTISEPVLACEAECSEKSVRRAIKKMEELQYLLVQRQEGRSSTYRINWKAIRASVAKDSGSPEVDGGTAVGATESPGSPGQRVPLHSRQANQERKSQRTADGVQSPGRRDWLGNVTRDQLKSAASVDRFYRQAVAAGVLKPDEANRSRFHALAVYAVRKGRSSGAAFRKGVEGHRWEWATDDDTDRARERIARLSKNGSVHAATRAVADSLRLPEGVEPPKHD